jgi:biopolymer transport protein ExbB/TolQ
VADHEKSLAQIVSELKVDAKDFLDTRMQMLRSEVQTKLAIIKVSAPMLLIGAVLGMLAAFCLTGAFVAVIAAGLGGGIGSWALSLFIVGCCYLVVGGGAAYFGYKQFSSEGLAPKRTIKILKQDQVWLANEARSQL